MKVILKNCPLVTKTKVSSVITTGRLENCYAASGNNTIASASGFYCDWYYNDGLESVEIEVKGNTTIYGDSVYIGIASSQPNIGTVLDSAKTSAHTSESIDEICTIEPHKYFCVFTYGFAPTIPTIELL